MIRGLGAKAPDDEQKAIRADAETARKDEKVAAESAYIEGLLEEELGKWTEAEKLFRQALKLSPGMTDDAGKYRVALARLLLRDRPEVVAPLAPAPPADEKKKDDKAGAGIFSRRPHVVGATLYIHPWTTLIVSAVIAQQPVEELESPETLARLKETMELAQELIASKNDKIKGQGYLLLGSALSKLGKRTEGLKEYSKGMQLLYPGIQTGEMKTLIDDHPAFQQPDSANSADPILAERHFGEGMHLYWSKQYPQAEAQFRQAVKYFDRDARYQYYLGLAQYNQRTKMKRDAAYFSWEQGARLEAKAATNPFAVREINATLERVQGEQRQLLNSFRYKAAEEAEAK
jgi:tetratricopeptide (TPR) repeat protein